MFGKKRVERLANEVVAQPLETLPGREPRREKGLGKVGLVEGRNDGQGENPEVLSAIALSASARSRPAWSDATVATLERWEQNGNDETRPRSPFGGKAVSSKDIALSMSLLDTEFFSKDSVDCRDVPPLRTPRR